MKSTLWYPKFQNPRIQASFDFWEKNFQPHQNFKPIKKFFCTFFTQCCLNLRSSLKHIKVQGNLKTQKLFTFSLFFTFSLSLFSQLTLGSRNSHVAKDDKTRHFQGFSTERARLGTFSGFRTFYQRNSFKNEPKQKF